MVVMALLVDEDKDEEGANLGSTNLPSNVTIVISWDTFSGNVLRRLQALRLTLQKQRKRCC